MNSSITVATVAWLVLSTLGGTAALAEKQTSGARQGAAVQNEARKKALREGWPDTPAGMVGSGWVEAFSSGEEAMRAFLEANLGQGDLAKRPIKERIAHYRKLRERFGALTLASVEKSARTELTVALLADDASTQRFVFTVGKEAPHRLVSVSFYDRVQGHGGHGLHR